MFDSDLPMSKSIRITHIVCSAVSFVKTPRGRSVMKLLSKSLQPMKTISGMEAYNAVSRASPAKVPDAIEEY